MAPSERDIRILIFLFSETLHVDGHAIGHKRLHKVLDLDTEIESYSGTSHKCLHSHLSWVARRILQRSHLYKVLEIDDGKLMDPGFVSRVKEA